MLQTRLENHPPKLQQHPWPPVIPSGGLTDTLRAFVNMSHAVQTRFLSALRSSPARHSDFVHRALAEVYSFVYGYCDSPVHCRRDDKLETLLFQAKVTLEAELLDFALPTSASISITTQEELAIRLRALVTTNPGVQHPLFEYLADRATLCTMREFLYHEVVRNEVVDDEVALLCVGQQGLTKSAVAINFFDEVGRGKLRHFHTYWLREYLSANNEWEGVREFRRRRPWFSYLSSNVFNLLLTRPSYKSAALGYFVVTEAWVSPHFEQLLHGMARVGLTQGDIYFTAHARLDPVHAEELITSIEGQVPRFTVAEVRAIYLGANLAIAAGVGTYDPMLSYLQSLEEPS